MHIKFIVLLTLLLTTACDTIVAEGSKCNDCSQMKSQLDCKAFERCIWTAATTTAATTTAATTTAATTTAAGSCTKTPDTPAVKITAFCPGIENPEIYCALSYGCAYLNGKCTHFAGCSAYVQTTISGCQAISFTCISDGTVCTDTLLCSKYSQSQCESTPNPYGRKCKWDSGIPACRDFMCSEADSTLISDTACDTFSAGCITTGAGCILPPLPVCAVYKGTEATCLQMVGSDGNCELMAGATNCKVKVCTGAPASIDSDTECNSYQRGCKTTGKGCIATLGQCSSYSVTNASSDCNGYIGTDGVCEGDVGTTVCRSRKCENGTGTSDILCNTYKQGCVTNGKGCATAKSACSAYTGTLTSCLGYIGTDGNCKGTSGTAAACQWTSTGSGTTATTTCTTKTCAQAAAGSTCNTIPSFDGTKYTICALVNNVCTAADPSTLTSTICYTKSQYTYSWNDSTSKCIACLASSTSINNTNTSNTTSTVNITTDTGSGYIQGVTIPLVFTILVG